MRHEQAYSDTWYDMPRDSYIECCDCGLTHTLKWRVRKGKVQMQFNQEVKRTWNARRKKRG